MKDIVIMTESTTCSICGGRLETGTTARVEWDIEIDGYTHRHRNECKRAADHHIVMEVIERVKYHPTPKAQTIEGSETESKEETKNKGDLSSVCFHLQGNSRTLPTLSKRNTRHHISQE